MKISIYIQLSLILDFVLENDTELIYGSVIIGICGLFIIAPIVICLSQWRKK